MQLSVTGEESPIFSELWNEWQSRRNAESEPKPEPHDSTWSRVYRRVTNWLKGPKTAQSETKLAAYRPTHRRTAHA